MAYPNDNNQNPYSLKPQQPDNTNNNNYYQSQAPQNQYQNYQQNPYGNQQNYQQNQYQQGTYLNGQPMGMQNTYQSATMQGTPFRATPYGNQQAAVQPVDQATFNDIMTKSFLFMFLALLVTAITALAVAKNPYTLYNMLYSNPGSIWIFIILEVGVVIGATFAMKANNAVLSGVLFFAYAIINGLTLSVIFLVYTSASITSTFFVTAGVFGALALIGYTTKKDLTNIGTLCMVGLFGIIIASIVNMFLRSEGFDYLISVVCIVVFLGLTAYDVQKIKKLASTHTGYNPMVIAMYGAMELYLDFINIFIRLLSIMGKRR